jgi:hypothetical protein
MASKIIFILSFDYLLLLSLSLSLSLSLNFILLLLLSPLLSLPIYGSKIGDGNFFIQ